MAPPRRSSIQALVAAGTLAASAAAQAPARDPDRGLSAELRERLAKVDPARDAFEVERWAALAQGRLDELVRRWEADDLAAGSAPPAWIAAELAVRPLGTAPEPPVLARGPWRITRAGAPGADLERLPFPAQLAAWRAGFGREASLLVEVQEAERDGDLVRTRLQLSARGASGGTRRQHEALWSCLWRAREDGLELVGVEPASLEAVELVGHPHGLFVDVSAEAFGAELARRELAPGLDAWRRAIPAALEPGTLGHHGLALGDANGDGREDLYWCRPGGLPNRLFLRTAEGLVEASHAAGVDLLDYTSSALLADLDGDEDHDLVVATGTGLHLFANEGPARFAQVLHVERPLPTSLAGADFDRDGDLDLYACAYLSPYEQSGTPVPYHRAENGEPNVLLRNDGAWRFTDVTAEVGLDANNRRFSLAAAWEDFDADGDADLYVVNDFGANNLYRNDGGRFRDVAAELGVLDVAAGMGVTWGDVDGDGWSDLYVTNLHSPAGMRLTARPGFRPGGPATEPFYRHHALGNSLFLNQAGRSFRDVSATSGTARGRWGWGALFVDLDGDGALDLFGPNGFTTGARQDDLDSFFWRQVVLQSPDAADGDATSYALGWSAVLRHVRAGWSWNGHERNVAFLNLGAGAFADVSGVTGLDLPDDARAAARLDWDGDGDEDLLVTNRSGPMLRLLRNESPPTASWLAVELRGAGRTPVGARVELETSGGRRLVRSLRCGEGYLAQSSARLLFALGGEEPRELSVRWPDGTRESFAGARGGAAWVLTRGTGLAAAPTAPTAAPVRGSSPPAPAPVAAGRTVLPAPLALPRLAFETGDGRAAALFGITMQGTRGTGQPLLLVLWSSADRSAEELARLVASAPALQAAALQVLAIPVDPPATRARARTRLDELAWPFAHAFASEEALQILELVLAALHQDAHGLATPAGLLVDSTGRLLATYAGTFDPERLQADLALAELSPVARRDACVPFPGRWLAPPPQPAELERAVVARLESHGLARTAAEYGLARIEVRTLPAAALEYERGVAHHRAGRLQEAIAHYRKALAADSAHAGAARDLAVALHQARDLDGALAAYERALALDPAHAQTRCNLGLLHLERGDRARAEGELQELRKLGSELVPKLEAALERKRKP